MSCLKLEALEVKWPTLCPDRPADCRECFDVEVLGFERRMGANIARMLKSMTLVEAVCEPGSGSRYVFWLARIYDDRDGTEKLLVVEPYMRKCMTLVVRPNMYLHWTYVNEKLDLTSHYEVVRLTGLLDAVRDSLAQGRSDAR